MNLVYRKVWLSAKTIGGLERVEEGGLDDVELKRRKGGRSDSHADGLHAFLFGLCSLYFQCLINGLQ